MSNVDHCPFCGRSLSPVFARFWFWIIVVFVVAALVVWFINVNLPEESTSPSSPATPELPQVIGSASNSSLKSLSPGTTIDNSGLKVSVKSVEAGPVTASGAQVYITLVEFENTRDATTTLYSTQWMLETSAGVRLDTFVGSSEDGTTLSSNFEAHELSAQARFSGELYFALSAPVDADGTVIGETPVPKLIVYQPSALAYSEDLLVTWSASS
ncbi:MAG: hypothetical protein FWD27_00470 [Coriobacteriia bacterium]|nr:hypothetical protein [Coriobacteriia bacterium]